MSISAFDLYRKTSGDTEWLGTFLSAELGSIEARRLAETVPGRYRLYDQVNGVVVFDQDNSTESV
jgi:hypothetical protein